MAEADGALREEIEKVRERARLQALAQGLGPDAAAQQGNVAVEEFCSRWGIRPEMVGPPVPRGGRAPGSPGVPHRDDSRKVDLGASPLRSTGGTGQTQAIRIADLLRKARETDAPANRPVPASMAAPQVRSGSNLNALLHRMRAGDSAPGRTAVTAAPVPSVPLPPPAAPSPPPALPRAAPPPAQGVVLRPPTQGDAFAGGGSGTTTADRRRQVLEEFDRTYAEVQSMLEQRIGVVDIALDDASKGIDGVMARARADGIPVSNLETLAADVNRLRQHLTIMMQMCDEFLGHVSQVQQRQAEKAPS